MPDELRLALDDLHGAVRNNVSLASYSHLRVGGPAEYLIEPFSETDVAQVVRVCHDLDIPLQVLGGGSNLLIPDQGVKGVVMMLGSLNRVVRDGMRLSVGAGGSLPTLLRGARELGLAGLEILTGIPAQVGGAVRMNAGTREGETFDHLVSLTVVDSCGELRVLARDDFEPRYRDGGIGSSIVVHATFELREDSPKAIYDRFESYLKYRNSTQPVTDRCLGCVFRNPDGEAAGRLIEEAGCKLLSHGGMSVSGKHANYFINEGGGTSADFMALMADVSARVKDRFGVVLEPEIKMWGE